MSFLIFLILSLSVVDKIGSERSRTVKLATPKEVVKVMVIDAKVNTKLGRFKNRVKPSKTPESQEIDNMDGHGDNVTSILLYGDSKNKKELCPEVEIISCTSFPEGVFNNTDYLQCLTTASVIGVKYINISMQYGVYNQDEYNILKTLTDKGVIITVAAGNSGHDYNEISSYPAAYDADSNVQIRGEDGRLRPLFTPLNDNFIVIQALNENGVIAKYSNTGAHALSEYGSLYMYDTSGDIIYSSGTSFASPFFLHNMILREVCSDK